MKLYFNENVAPVAQDMYRIPYSSVDKVNEKLQELKDNDIIKSVNKPSKWMSPMIVCPKRDGTVRLVIDMCKANVAIEREKHPILTVHD